MMFKQQCDVAKVFKHNVPYYLAFCRIKFGALDQKIGNDEFPMCFSFCFVILILNFI